MGAFLAVDFRRFCADLLLASVLVSVALESSRGKSNTLEFDDPYKGFATFSCSQNDVTAERTCRKTREFGLRTRSANRGQFSMDGSAVWGRFWHRFHSKIVPESMEMTSEEPGDSGGRLGSVLGASRELQDGSGDGRMAKPQTKVGPPWVQSRSVKRKRVGGYCFADCILLQNLTKSASTSEHACQGAAD